MSKQANAKSGDSVELADKETSFYDPKTQFKVVRDASEKLGKTIGDKTNIALLSGRLLVVEGKSGKQSKQAESDLPEDFPGRDAFVAAGLNLEQVKTFDFEGDKVAGVGDATIKSVQEYLSK